MSLTPLLNAAPAIPIHASAAMAAFVLGLVQLTAPKGRLPHRTLGWIWVALMTVVAGSSFGIHELRTGARAGSGRGARSTCCRSSRWSCSLSA